MLGGAGCGCEGPRRGDAAAVVLRRRGGLAGGAAGDWMALMARRAWQRGGTAGGIALPLRVGLQTLRGVQLSKSTLSIPYREVYVF